MTGFGFLFPSDPFCLHPVFFACIIFFVCILSFLFALSFMFALSFLLALSFLVVSDLFCLHPIFFVCRKPFFIALTLVGHRSPGAALPRTTNHHVNAR